MKKIYIFNILNGVNDSFLGLKISGMKIEKMKLYDFVILIKDKDKDMLSHNNLSRKLSNFTLNNDIYFLKKSLNLDESEINSNFNKLKNSIEIELKKLRLLYGVDIFLASSYLTTKKMNKLTVFSICEINMPHIFEINKLSDNIRKANKKLNSINISHINNTLILAWDFYDKGALFFDKYSSILALITSLEIMFSPDDKSELKYRVSRNASILLSTSTSDFEEIFKDLKNFYDIRSKLVHSGSAIITKDDYLKLKEYIRKLLVKCITLNKNKDDLLKLLNIKGYNIIIK